MEHDNIEVQIKIIERMIATYTNRISSKHYNAAFDYDPDIEKKLEAEKYKLEQIKIKYPEYFV